MSFVTNISVMRKMYNIAIGERAIIFISSTQFLTTNWCDITQRTAITGGMATSFGLGALGFDSRQGQRDFLFLRRFRQSMGSTLLPIGWVPWFLFRR